MIKRYHRILNNRYPKLCILHLHPGINRILTQIMILCQILNLGNLTYIKNKKLETRRPFKIYNHHVKRF